MVNFKDKVLTGGFIDSNFLPSIVDKMGETNILIRSYKIV